MFVLKNAWSSIVRRKWRTLLTMFIAIIVTFGTLFGFSVLHADESATDGYNPQLVSAVIRPDAKTKATYNGADSSYTKNYLAFDAYDNYASALQAAGLTYSYALTITRPVQDRQGQATGLLEPVEDRRADFTGVREEERPGRGRQVHRRVPERREEDHRADRPRHLRVHGAGRRRAGFGLYAADGKGWLIPDLNISFLLDSMSTYRKFEKVIKKAKLPANHELTSPTLIEHEKQIAPLRSLASSMKPMLAALWIVGAVLLLLSWGSSLLVGRRREIGNQIVIGVSRGRIAWQFMLETLLLNLVGFAVGMVVGAFAVKPLATKLADGNAVSVPGNLIWTVIWSGLGTIVVLMVIAMIRVLLFRVRTLFAARSSNEVEVVDDGGTDDTATSDNAANDSDTADADDTAESAQEQA